MQTFVIVRAADETIAVSGCFKGIPTWSRHVGQMLQFESEDAAERAIILAFEGAEGYKALPYPGCTVDTHQI